MSSYVLKIVLEAAILWDNSPTNVISLWAFNFNLRFHPNLAPAAYCIVGWKRDFYAIFNPITFKLH